MAAGPPLYDGMPPTDRVYETAFGAIRAGGACRDDYDRIIPWQNRAGQILRIQKPAARSLEDAERRLGFAVRVTGAHRTCEQQEAYYASDPNRYAPPDKTAHPRGLAIDVDTRLGVLRRARLKRALRARGWHQARPDDEPWHWSYGIEV